MEEHHVGLHSADRCSWRTSIRRVGTMGGYSTWAHLHRQGMLVGARSRSQREVQTSATAWPCLNGTPGLLPDGKGPSKLKKIVVIYGSQQVMS